MPEPPEPTRAPEGLRLGYCTNVHPYADLEGLLAALEGAAAPLRDRLVAAGELDDGAPLGVGLWFPEAVAHAVVADPAPLRAALERLRLDAFTVNAFPQGAFHGDVVKEAVFRPTWAEAARLDYTLTAARALATLLPAGGTGSLSTHTGGTKAMGLSPGVVAAGLVAAAEGLARLEDETGRRLLLALEPEPLSFLETTEEVCAFFTEHLHPAGEAARRHLALCYDACHQAVEFEDMAASVGRLAEAEVPVAKVQLSSAIRVPAPAAAVERLRPFAEDRWFHQVVSRAEGGALTRWTDLPVALDDAAALAAAEWRVHYHVPLFAESLDDGPDGLLTTRPQLEELLAEVTARDATRHFEIETYTWEALPAARREALGLRDVVDCLEQEFRWVLPRLAPPAAD